MKSPTSSPFFLSAETPPHLVAGSPPASAPRRHGVADGWCQRVSPSREVSETAPLSNAAIRLRRRPSLSCSLHRRCCPRGGSPSQPSIYLSLWFLRDAAVVRELGSCSSRPPDAVADAAQSAPQTSADATVPRIPPSSSRSGSPIQFFFFKS